MPSCTVYTNSSVPTLYSDGDLWFVQSPIQDGYGEIDGDFTGYIARSGSRPLGKIVVRLKSADLVDCGDATHHAEWLIEWDERVSNDH